MSLLPHKNILTVAAVIDIALNVGDGVVSGKEVATRHHLPSRHLEPVLQALVREGILKGVRGPHGGYKLAREARRITAADILRAARTIDRADTSIVFVGFSDDGRFVRFGIAVFVLVIIVLVGVSRRCCCP